MPHVQYELQSGQDLQCVVRAGSASAATVRAAVPAAVSTQASLPSQPAQAVVVGISQPHQQQAGQPNPALHTAPARPAIQQVSALSVQDIPKNSAVITSTIVSGSAGVVTSGARLPSGQILVSQTDKAGTTSTVQVGNRIKQRLALSNSSVAGARKLTVAGTVQGTAGLVRGQIIRQNVPIITDSDPALVAKQPGKKVGKGKVAQVSANSTVETSSFIQDSDQSDITDTVKRPSPDRVSQEDLEQASSYPVSLPTPTVETSCVIKNSNQSSVIKHTAASYSVSPATETNSSDKQDRHQSIRKEVASKPTLAGVSVDVFKQILSQNPKASRVQIGNKEFRFKRSEKTKVNKIRQCVYTGKRGRPRYLKDGEVDPHSAERSVIADRRNLQDQRLAETRQDLPSQLNQ